MFLRFFKKSLFRIDFYSFFVFKFFPYANVETRRKAKKEAREVREKMCVYMRDKEREENGRAWNLKKLLFECAERKSAKERI